MDHCECPHINRVLFVHSRFSRVSFLFRTRVRGVHPYPCYATSSRLVFLFSEIVVGLRMHIMQAHIVRFLHSGVDFSFFSHRHAVEAHRISSLDTTCMPHGNMCTPYCLRLYGLLRRQSFQWPPACSPFLRYTCAERARCEEDRGNPLQPSARLPQPQ